MEIINLTAILLSLVLGLIIFVYSLQTDTIFLEYCKRFSDLEGRKDEFESDARFEDGSNAYSLEKAFGFMLKKYRKINDPELNRIAGLLEGRKWVTILLLLPEILLILYVTGASEGIARELIILFKLN